MKKYYYLFATLLVCLPIACNKVNEQEETPQTPAITYIRANGNEDGTKGSVDGTSAAFTWNTGDQIAVYTTDKGYMVSTALEEGDNGKSTVDFGFSKLDDTKRANFAIFPAALVSGIVSDFTATSLKLNLPASYTLAEVENEVSPTPMIASNAPGGSLSFKALCPLLRITVNNIPKQTKRIEFDFNGNKVQGEFTLTGVTPGETAIATAPTEGTDDIITVTMAGNTEWHNYIVVNLPVPTGTYGNITITAKDGAGLPVLKLTTPIKSDASAWKPKRKASRTITATLPVFTMADGKHYTFAPGNLKYSNGVWSFHTNQYDRCFTVNGDVSGSYSSTGTFDLFCWGTSGWNNTESDPTWVYYAPWNTGIVRNYNPNNGTGYGPSFALSEHNLVGANREGDWGVHNSIRDGSITYDAGTWKTPTNNEWKYVFQTRSCESYNLRVTSNSDKACFKKATVANVEGLIVFPDKYIHPLDVTYTNSYGYNNWSLTVSYFTVDADNWVKMEAAGAVFLPATGLLNDNNSGELTKVGARGYYWTSTTKDKDDAYRCVFTEESHDVGGANWRYHGYAVRLVRDLN